MIEEAAAAVEVVAISGVVCSYVEFAVCNFSEANGVFKWRYVCGRDLRERIVTVRWRNKSI